MTIVVVTRDRMVSDSRLTYGESHYEVGKIFRLQDGSLMATAGDGKLTYPFERAWMGGEEPELPDTNSDDDVEFEGVILNPDGTLTLYDDSYSPNRIGGPFVVIGSSQATGAALWRLKHDASPEEAVAAGIEVDNSCGGRIVTVMLHDKAPSAMQGARKPRVRR